jgi:hypothetical protein
MKGTTMLDDLASFLRVVQSAARVSAAFKAGRRAAPKDLARLGISPEAFASIRT